MKKLRQEKINIEGGTIPITLYLDEDVYVIDIDGIEWLETETRMHAVVLFEMMKDNITKYMNYIKM